MENKKILSNKFMLIIIAVLGIIIYHQVVSFQFINWDDNFYVMNNPYIRAITLSNIGYLFTHYYYNGVYEPLQILSYMLIYQINGSHPLWFHVFNALIFIFDAMLIYVLVKELTTPLTAAIASILFLLAPVNADSAAWVSELKNTQSLFFVLISIILYIAFIKNTKKSYYAFSILFFLFALLTKQTVATMIIIFFLLEWYMYNRSASNTFLVQIPFYLLAVLAVPVFVIGQLNLHASNPSQLGNAFQHLLTVLMNISGILSYPVKIIFPVHLVCFYPTFIVSSALTLRFILSITALIVFICLLVVFYKRRHKGFFWLSWYFINMLPAYGIVVMPFYTNWYLFLPSIGVYTLIGMGVEYIYNTANLKKLSIAVTVIIIVLFGLLDYQRVGVWRDDTHLWKDAIKKSPDYYFGYEMYASTLVKQGNIPEAIIFGKKALALNPYQTKILSGLGYYYLQNKEYGKALPYLEKAVKYAPDNVVYVYQLATYYRETKDYTNYEKELRKCALLDPYMISYVNELGEYYVNNGETDKALSFVKEIISQHPDNALFYRLLGAYYFKYTNNTYEAKKAFEKSLFLDPHQQDVQTLKQLIKKIPK